MIDTDQSIDNLERVKKRAKTAKTPPTSNEIDGSTTIKDEDIKAGAIGLIKDKNTGPERYAIIQRLVRGGIHVRYFVSGRTGTLEQKNERVDKEQLVSIIDSGSMMEEEPEEKENMDVQKQISTNASPQPPPATNRQKIVTQDKNVYGFILV